MRAPPVAWGSVTGVRKVVGVVAAALLGLVGCTSGGETTATSTPVASPLELTDGDLDRALLTTSDAGDKWEAEEDPSPSTVLIGGEVGPANLLARADAEATSAFEADEGTGYLSNTLLLVENEALARAVMAKHDEADADTRFAQERNDGGRAVFRRTGRVADLPSLGDESYSATLSVKNTDAKGEETSRKVEYVAYRINNLLAFVVTQDARAAVYALRQEAKVTRLVA